ncbi:MAG: EamA family transporter, partial [Clostridia bacterium]|nr:EamA family transporter [Clostridia bacterium]
VALALAIFVYVIKREPIRLKGQGSRAIAASCEAAGQFTYVYAMSGNGMVAAPMIASYCVASVVLARIFLKEKLTLKQYLMILLVFIGILLLGITEGLAE